MSDITIRPAVLADARGLAEVQVDSYRTAYADLLPPAYTAHFTYEEQTGDWQELLPTLTGPLLVAVDGSGRVLGYALGSWLEEAAAACELDAIHVRQSAQGQGIGRQLFAALVDHFRDGGAGSLLLWTLAGNPVRAWYEKLGGQLIERGFTIVDDEGGRVPKVAYAWDEIDGLAAALAGDGADDEAATVHYRAAGGVVWDGHQVLLLRRPSRGEIRLPKGHIDPGESAREAALRETEEESGYGGLAVVADLGDMTVEFTYQGRHIQRYERYFLLKTTPDATVGQAESQFIPTWFSWAAAQDRLTFAAERAWLDRARVAAQEE